MHLYCNDKSATAYKIRVCNNDILKIVIELYRAKHSLTTFGVHKNQYHRTFLFKNKHIPVLYQITKKL